MEGCSSLVDLFNSCSIDGACSSGDACSTDGASGFGNACSTGSTGL